MQQSHLPVQLYTVTIGSFQDVSFPPSEGLIYLIPAFLLVSVCVLSSSPQSDLSLVMACYAGHDI